jgi:hypothetical protein
MPLNWKSPVKTWNCFWEISTLKNIIGKFVSIYRSFPSCLLAAWLHKFCCFLCEWDSRDKSIITSKTEAEMIIAYSRTVWCSKYSITHPWISLFTCEAHQTRTHKNFSKAMNHKNDGFMYQSYLWPTNAHFINIKMLKLTIKTFV